MGYPGAMKPTETNAVTSLIVSVLMTAGAYWLLNVHWDWGVSWYWFVAVFVFWVGGLYSKLNADAANEKIADR